MKTEKHLNNYSHILKYTGLFGGIQGLAILVGVVRNKLIALILGPQGVGVISLYNSTVKLISDSTNFGLGMSAVKELSECYERGDRQAAVHQVNVIRSWSLLTALLGLFVCIVFSPLLNQWMFGDKGTAFHFVLLSLVVAMTAIAGGEIAILKGVRKLARLAKISSYHILGALVTSVPLYYFFHDAAIVPTLIINVLIQMLLAIYFSHRLFPFHFSLKKQLLVDGFSLIKLGTAFVIAGILGSGAEFLIKTYLNTAGSVETVGLYNAGYMVTMTYAGVIFSAMETDYFPRLSGIVQLGSHFNNTVNRQIEVSLLLVTPMIVFMLATLPVLLPLLYSSAFMSVLPMMQITMIAMFFRALKLPVAYIPLSRGDSKSYLILESIYDVLIVLLVCFGFHYWGLKGTGAAITGASIIDFIVLFVYAKYKYRFSISKHAIYYALMQFPILLATYLLTSLSYNWLYWITGTGLSIASAYISIRILNRKTGGLQSIFGQFTKRNDKNG